MSTAIRLAARRLAAANASTMASTVTGRRRAKTMGLRVVFMMSLSNLLVSMNHEAGECHERFATARRLFAPLP
jgi:hypothetical protein